MIHIGLDVHKHKTKVAVLDDKTGEIEKPYDVVTGELVDHIRQMPGAKRMAMETSTVSQFVGRQLESCGLDVMVVDAFKCHRLLEALSRSKTDKLDALGLSLLLARGMLETARVWLPSHAIHELRELVRVRKALVSPPYAQMFGRWVRGASSRAADIPVEGLGRLDAGSWADDMLLGSQ